MTDPARLRNELEEIALAGDGYGAILARLASETGRTARLVAVHGGLLATSEPDVPVPAASAPASGVPASASTAGGLDTATARRALACDGLTEVVCTDGLAALAAPVRAGGRRIGLVLLAAPADADALRAATVPIAIEAVRRDAETAAVAESAGRLVDELRFGSLRAADQLARAAERFGLALDRPHAAAVFEYDGPNVRAWATAVRWIEMPVRQEGERGWTVLAGDVAAELRRIRERLAGIVGEGTVLAASGPTVSDPGATPRSFREAEVVLALARRTPGTVELPYDALGLQALLLSVPAERLAAFVESALGPILASPDLLVTLEAWYETNGSRAAVANRLGIHRNSVGYRMGRVRELLGVDPLDPWQARRLQGALDARDVLAALADAGR
ncbi:MAG: hypothetical protein KatS3mg009_0593 [Acidimicrobiia bacterium]|nr:MAG: hypothetical protein KatS3mg009_0593 [Acidimicrobiia bacterium]